LARRAPRSRLELRVRELGRRHGTLRDMTAFEVLTCPYHVGERVPVALTDRPHREVQAPTDASTDPVLAVAEAVARATAGAVDGGQRPLLFGGDCLAPLGLVAGLQRAGVDPAAVVWFDGHGDFNTPETTPSGYLPGMALALLVGRGSRRLIDGLGMRPVDEHAVALVGARDLDPAEAEAITGSRLLRTDVAGVTQAADRLPAGPLYVHVDVDVVDPADMPGMGFPASGGPSLQAVADALGALADAGHLAAVSFGITFRRDGHQAADAVVATDSLASVLLDDRPR
ncbi:MAG TPA: arginase family protein, partial [Euzebyales bacterium]|nr:arginase family protein [Euzebyales bacterium]